DLDRLPLRELGADRGGRPGARRRVARDAALESEHLADVPCEEQSGQLAPNQHDDRLVSELPVELGRGLRCLRVAIRERRGRRAWIEPQRQQQAEECERRDHRDGHARAAYRKSRYACEERRDVEVTDALHLSPETT